MMKNDISKTQPFVVGISGISGAGKSTLIQKLSELLKATTIFWDDFDEISKAPEDYVQWYTSSKKYDDWVYTDLSETLRQLKAGRTVLCPATKKELQPTEYILFDAPLGYCHRETGKHIDFLICLNTPPDIALARRLLREHKSSTNIKAILEDLEYYLTRSRPLFILSAEEKKCDLSIDGSFSIQDQFEKALVALKRMHSAKIPSKISIDQRPLSNELKQHIYQGFSLHAIAVTGYDEKFDPTAFIAQIEGGSFVGAIVVEQFWGALHIKYVYVEESFRNQGIGTALMEYALTYGRSCQCPFAFVETMSFQALEFYKKMGFELEFTRPGYKHNTSFHYLRKNL